MISAVIHTYNEEKNIERCLAALTFTDEVIVVDMGSTDKTCQIATNYHAKIFLLRSNNANLTVIQVHGKGKNQTRRRIAKLTILLGA